MLPALITNRVGRSGRLPAAWLILGHSDVGPYVPAFNALHS